jgi:mannose-6-phosphate isomerase
MEPTDFAVRIEFERGGYVLPEESRFMNRGIDFALSMFSYEATSIETIRERFFCTPTILAKQKESIEYSLVNEDKTSCFRVNRLNIKDRYIKNTDTFYICIVTRGSGTITIDDETYPLNEGSKFFIPFQTGSVTFESKAGIEIIATFPPR